MQHNARKPKQNFAKLLKVSVKVVDLFYMFFRPAANGDSNHKAQSEADGMLHADLPMHN